MIVDKGGNFPQEIDATLRKYGEGMWFFREQPGDTTTRALNSYIGDHRKWVPNNTTYPPRSTPGVSNCVPSPVTLMRLLVLCFFFLLLFSCFTSFQYLTPRIRITPRDLTDTPLFRSTALHFICSPTRAAVIMSQVAEVEGWSPISIYEPIPVRTHIIFIPSSTVTPNRRTAPRRACFAD